MKPALRVELHAEPLQVTAVNRSEFLLGFTVRNLGTVVVGPNLNMSQLTVNGAPAPAWNVALGNSGHPKNWRTLPPGDSVSGRWALADELFPMPGTYKLVLTVQGIASTPVTVQVSAAPR